MPVGCTRARMDSIESTNLIPRISLEAGICDARSNCIADSQKFDAVEVAAFNSRRPADIANARGFKATSANRPRPAAPGTRGNRNTELGWAPVGRFRAPEE